MTWTELVSSIRMNDGWLIYAGKIGLIQADVWHASLNVEMNMVDVTSAFSPGRQMVPGTTDIHFAAQLADKYQWSKPVTDAPPPNLAALLVLARRHPEEYEKLCEGEAILKALGG